MNISQTVLALGLLGACPSIAAADVVVHVSQDYMTSGFFASAPFIRGQEANSGRAVNRVSSNSVFGVAGENAYFGFDFNPAAFSGPVTQAHFIVETAVGGFGSDASDAAPAQVSVHSLSADPLAAIDINSASSWQSFRAAEITAASAVDTITVGDFGVYSWDVTDLVNAWISGGDSVYAYTIAASGIFHTGADFFVGFVNSTAASLSPDAVTARLVIVPAPGVGALLLATGALSWRRRRA